MLKMTDPDLSVTLPSGVSSENSSTVLPLVWAAQVEPQLLDEERVLAWLEINLDARLYFSSGLVVVTNKRLLGKTGSDVNWQEWPYRPKLRLARYDHSGVGSLELLDENSLLVRWRYTLGGDAAARRLADHFNQQLDLKLTGREHQLDAEVEAMCPRCGAALDAPLPPGQEECATCRGENAAPPSTWTLFRLWRFAKPYKGRLLAGFLLTLASTAATLVPPYLTMPLMDNVLIPYQNGKPIDADLVTFYLAGLLGAALSGLGAGLGANLHAGAGVRAHRRRPAHRHLRAPAASSRMNISAASAPAT